MQKNGLLSVADVESARQLQRSTGGQLLEILVRIGAIDEDTLLQNASEVWGIPLVQDAALPQDPEDLTNATRDLGLNDSWLASRQAAVWRSEDPDGHAVLNLAACNPLDPAIQEEFDRAFSHYADKRNGSAARCVLSILSKSQLETIAAVNHAGTQDHHESADSSDLSRLKELAEEAPIIDLVNQIFSAAIKHRASDIHIEPYEKFFEIRLRVDGVVQSWQRQPISKFDAVSTRIKLISAMDIAERRLPQDGRQSIRLSGQTFDLRVSSLPGAWGESLVLRLLSKHQSLPTLSQLGITGRGFDEFTTALRQSNGIVLVTGPTGSGKSTTLYTGLQSINDGQKKIITIEDPIEYNMERVTQVQVKSDIGLTFASGLRSILRQDPDVIMIGEIRDPETARIAIQSALTGHLVLSTLHTNSSLLAIPRLLDLGLEAFQIGAAIKAIAAQRLVRKLCETCKVEESAPDQLDVLVHACDSSVVKYILRNRDDVRWCRHVGCPSCAGTGYSGRTALFEIVRIDQVVKTAMMTSPSPMELERAARQQGFRRLAEDGLDKAARGITSIEEVLRVVGDERAMRMHDDRDENHL
ncbi:MAG: type II/IV secretion system protein [Rhodobiaceae bacterium]|nr:type II/IV secretion system protein [Rhodobiaceae bacterium]